MKAPGMTDTIDPIRAPSLGEIFGDAAALVDPRDEGAVAAALDRVLSDGALRERLVGAMPVVETYDQQFFAARETS